ncbi:Ectopic P granules protein 5-like protein [Hypsibius exemplaris]|uniref:Ectopic P granules protein 5-like protein n=1 Tax=Hypsibius exemplaris TaxID=2072580 RepID=A0A1W0WZW0_HYPEX|nr:Ectopic P granules protein 5-like protein [Hypsibius exemplaris]
MEAVRVRKPKNKKVKEKVEVQEEEKEFFSQSADGNDALEVAREIPASKTMEREEAAVLEEASLNSLRTKSDRLPSPVLLSEDVEARSEESEKPLGVQIGSVSLGKSAETLGDVAEPLGTLDFVFAPVPPLIAPIPKLIASIGPESIRNFETILAVEKSATPNTMEAKERVLIRNPLAQNRPVEAVRSSAPLYPSLSEKQRIVAEPRPLTRAEMAMYFVNAEARSLEGVIDQFIDSNLVGSFLRHPLYIYLNEYLKAVTAYEAALQDLKKIQRLCEQTREDVWKITDQRVSETGRCADNKAVTGEHFYRQCHLNKVALTEFGMHLESIRSFLYDTSFRFKCTAELARFQVECFLFEVLRDNPLTGGLRDCAAAIPRGDFVKTPETAEIRICVSVLFAFHRMPLGSEKFRSDIKAWLTGSVGILIRASSFFDQLFLLNHLLRCPSSVLQWASVFLQLTVPPSFSSKNCHNPFVKHFVTMLQCLLMPAKSRDDYLSAFTINQSSMEDDDKHDGDSSWIVVDPDAEGDMEVMKLTTTMDVEENDVFYLLKQFPFDGLFSCLFGSDTVNLEPFAHITEYDVLGLFGFCYEFLELLVQGLDNTALNKYARFNKKNAQIIRELIVHCKEFWERLQEVKGPSDPMIQKLRLNFEELVMRGMYLLLEHGKNGTLQFLVGWPTKCLSLANLWRTVVILESLSDSEVPYRADLFYWRRELTDLHSNSSLQKKLQSLDESNSTYLLTALAEVLKQCDKGLPLSDLVESVTMELLRISFLGPLRATYAKLGRDLICSICAEYPALISDVSNFTWKNLEQVGSMAVFLFQDMPLKLWRIGRSDIDNVCERLVTADAIQDPVCLLAREILSNLNWGFAEGGGELWVDPTVHQYVAVAIVEAFLKFISTKNRRLLLYESLLRLSSMVTTGKSTPEQLFVGWCWEVLLDLKLHRLAQHPDRLATLRNNAILDETIPNLSRDAVTLSPLNAVQVRQPMACYVAVMLTDMGHSTSGVLKQGLDWIASLVEQYLYIPALETLEVVTPLFFANNQSVYLLQQDQFHFVMNCLLQADATYTRMVKNILAFEFPGKTLKSFGNMVIHQLLQAGPNLAAAMGFWCRILTALKNWNRTAETLYVLDQVVKFAFYAGEMKVVLTVLREAYEEYRESQPSRGSGMTALVSWMTAGTSPAYILIDSTKLAAAPWLGYAVLQVETVSSSGLWALLLDVLTAEKKRTFEEGLKKAAQKLDMSVPTVPDLPLFRLAEVIIAVSVESEIFPLLCQEFFRLFLQRSVNHVSIGDQFFLSNQASKLLKPIKQKLRDAAEYYRTRGAAPSERSLAFFEDLQHAVRAFALWMDEPKIHHANFYLPSLPREYQPEMLSTVLNAHSEPWSHFVDIQTVYASMRQQAEHWLPFEVRPVRRRSGLLSSPIRGLDTPLGPPSTYPAASPFVPVDASSLFDPSKILFALRPDLTTIQEAAKAFVNRVVEHGSLDGYFLELIAELNTNVEKHVTVYPTCHKSQCSGPAEIELSFKEFSRNDAVHRAYLQNREEWNNMVLRAQKIDLKPLVTSVVRFEKAISLLINSTKTCSPARVAEVGAVLFYHMLVFIGQESDEHPLTRKFFHSCVDVLGQNFIANQKAQCRPLLDTCLNNPLAIPMLILHFTPNIVPQEFLLMYKKSQTLQGKNNEALIQLLSTFDVKRYLNEPSVNVSSRMEFLSTLAYGISQLDSSPSFQDSPLFEIYCQHIRNLVEFRFPLHLVDVLRCLLDLSSKTVFPPSGWSSCFFSALGISAQTENVAKDDWERDFTGIREAMADGRISLELALVIAQLINHFFGNIRRDNKTAKAFGLFSILGQYTRVVAVLLLTLSTVSLRDEPKTEDTFAFVVHLFHVWLSEEHAFLQADLPIASQLISALRLVLAELSAKNADTLRLVWQWFYHSYSVPPTESFVAVAISMELTKLPWEQFIPDSDSLQSFVAVTEAGTQEVRVFVGNLTERIPWGRALAHNRNERFLPFLVDIVKVVTFYGTDEKFRPFKTGIAHFIKETVDFEWSCLEYPSLQAAVHTLARNPEVIASWCGANEDIENCSIVLFLKLITQFETANLNPTQYTVEKRALFVQIYGRAAVAFYTARKSADLPSFIISTLKACETAWISSDPQIRYQGYLALASEIFNLSNHVADKKIDNLIRNAVLIWIAQNAGSPLLISMVAGCCRCVASVEAMVAYLETLIAAHFAEPYQRDWWMMVHVLETPELSSAEFIKTCLAKQAFLTLHAHFLRIIQTADSVRRIELMQSLVEWCKIRPLPDHQNKVFLLWNHVFLLGSSASVDVWPIALRDFVEALFGFTEEKGGLLSAIGVGKPPVLSRPFKIVTRSIVAVASPLTTPGKTTGKAATLTDASRTAYEEMKSRKEYLPYAEVWPVVDAYLASQGTLTWADVRKLLGTLLGLLFKQQNYLSFVIES